jgi:hypothetical protein
MAELFIVDQVDKALEEIKLLVGNLRAVSFAVRSMKADESRKVFLRSVSGTLQKQTDKITLHVNELDDKLHKHDMV